MPEQRLRLRQVLIQNRFIDGDFAAAEHLSRDALAEYPDDGEFAWALITAQANRGDMDRAAASYRQLRPALINPGHVSLWLDLLGRRPVTDTDVEAAHDAAGQWPGTEQARRLIEGTVALIATAPASGSQLQTGVSAQNLRRLGVVIPAIPRGSQLAAASRSEQPHLPRLRVSGDALKLGAATWLSMRPVPSSSSAFRTQPRDPKRRLIPSGQHQPPATRHVTGQHRQRGPAFGAVQHMHVIQDQQHRHRHRGEGVA